MCPRRAHLASSQRRSSFRRSPSAVALILRGLWLLLIPIAMSFGIGIGVVVFLSRGARRLHPDDPPPKRSPWILPIGLTILILLLLFGPIGLFVYACNREWANY
jgi:hypothetical protein